MTPNPGSPEPRHVLVLTHGFPWTQKKKKTKISQITQRLENRLDLSPVEQRKEEGRHQRDANSNSVEGELQGAPERGQTSVLGPAVAARRSHGAAGKGTARDTSKTRGV